MKSIFTFSLQNRNAGRSKMQISQGGVTQKTLQDSEYKVNNIEIKRELGNSNELWETCCINWTVPNH